MKQWHPLFARLLRPLLEGYYDLQTTVPVGDAPREADIVLLRRTAAGQLPFRGLWKDLTTWNILEFKGPTVSPRLRHLDLLVELGLGIDRRLNEERLRQRRRPLGPEEVSFWYLVNKLGRRFLREARRKLGHVAEQGSGVWRCTVLQRQVFLVSSVDLPVEPESVPLHLISRESTETAVAVARLVVERPQLWELYDQWLIMLHPAAWKEVQSMARAAKGAFKVDFRPAIEEFGLAQVIAGVGIEEIVATVGVKRIIDEVGLKRVLDELGVKQVVDEVGLKRVVDEVGLKRVVDEVGLKRVVDEVGLKRVVDEVGLKRVVDEVGLKRVLAGVGLDEILANLTPAQRQELKRRLR